MFLRVCSTSILGATYIEGGEGGEGGGEGDG